MGNSSFWSLLFVVILYSGQYSVGAQKEDLSFVRAEPKSLILIKNVTQLPFEFPSESPSESPSGSPSGSPSTGFNCACCTHLVFEPRDLTIARNLKSRQECFNGIYNELGNDLCPIQVFIEERVLYYFTQGSNTFCMVNYFFDVLKNQEIKYEDWALDQNALDCNKWDPTECGD